MQDLMQEQIPVPIKEWSRASVKAQIQINTTKKNVRKVPPDKKTSWGKRETV